MIYPIYLYGSAVLRQKAAPVDLRTVDPAELRQFVDDLYETMKKADGCGLAAPQVGRSIRVLVVCGEDLADHYPYLKGFRRAMVNPEITWSSEGTNVLSEGCLSVPDVDADVERPLSIKVRYYDADLKQCEEQFDEFAARMVLHEIDHLEGIIFTDHASPIRRKMISGKLNGISKGCVRTSYKVKTDRR